MYEVVNWKEFKDQLSRQPTFGEKVTIEMEAVEDTYSPTELRITDIRIEKDEDLKADDAYSIVLLVHFGEGYKDWYEFYVTYYEKPEVSICIINGDEWDGSIDFPTRGFIPLDAIDLLEDGFNNFESVLALGGRVITVDDEETIDDEDAIDELEWAKEDVDGDVVLFWLETFETKIIDTSKLSERTRKLVLEAARR